jgi:uncharacterized membrane protein
VTVFDLFLALHVLAAIFAIGPLAHAVTTASRGLRTGDATATATSARTARIYAYASLVVVILGFGLMSMKEDGKAAGDFTEPWIWISVLLWAVAVAVTLAVIVPSLEKATTAIGNSEAVATMTGKVAASGGVVALLFAVIVFLMVYKPGH